MQKSNLTQYIHRFFDALELTADDGSKHAKELLEQSVLAFLDDETKDTAFDVYTLFFGFYRIVLEGSQNPFMDLLDVLRMYEERAATLIEKQRDHYIHSVNVFVLGLCIYIQSPNFQAAFHETVMDKDRYPENYQAKHEEFFFRWGLAALFHDVGYPVEIIGKQIVSFLRFATNADHDGTKGDIKAHLAFENFRRLNSIAEVVPKKKFIDAFYEANDSSVYIDLLQPIDLLAQKIHMSLGIPIDAIKDKLDHFTADMAAYGFIDHGFYSAIIVLKWYGYLLQKTGGNPLRFFHAIVDSAGAILLHNYYRNVICKEFTHRPLRAVEYPIAYLLMLCDELQEWNRAGYGTTEKYRTHANSAQIAITGQCFAITYLAGQGVFKDEFITEKIKLFDQILNIREIFADGLQIQCDTLDTAYIEARQDKAVPRPLLENLETLAREIHTRFIKSQKALNAPINVNEDFDKLEASVRYSNLRQAMNMDKFLRKLGYAIVAPSHTGEPVRRLPDAMVEQYAMLEHDDWMAGKLRFGWRYAPVRNNQNKEHPCLVPWDKLPEAEKDKDRAVALNLPDMAALAGMKIIKL
ncbi:MAG TPA: RyR domain-containing protein [Candidatus Limiplasma sp.]|nr:RyR domain-containing protein [Candidatus Limiplasma sp.]